MNIQEKKLRDIISQEIKKIAGVNETDLVASDKTTWDNKKTEFKTLVSNLLNNIETDDYDDAAGEIVKTMGILKTWKSRINKGLMDSSVTEGIFSKKTNQFTVQDALKSVLGNSSAQEDYTKFVVPGSVEYDEMEDVGGYTLYCTLAIPGHQLNVGVLVVHNNVNSKDEDVAQSQLEVMQDEIGSTYNGENPGGYYSKVNIKYLGRNDENYIYSVYAKKGMDV